MMWFLLLLCMAHIELVISQGDVNRLILRNANNSCKGHVEIYHNGIKGYVGAVNWNERIEEVVCRSTHCGKPSSSSYMLRPLISTVWLNDLHCSGNESHLWDCYYPGWGISYYPQDTMKMITCSNEIKFSLEGSECAGAVKYSTEGGGTSGYFCADNWGMDQAKLLCKHINCGEPKEFIQEEWMGWKEFHKSPKMMINCSGIENVQNLWQCVTQEAESECLPATVICEDYERLQLKGNRPNVCHGQLEREEGGNWNPVKNSKEIQADPWCQQMHCGSKKSWSQNDSGTWLTCTDNVSVSLMDNGKNTTLSCYGTVHIEMNAVRHPVCASSWSQMDAEVVCNELGCGKVISQSTRGSSPQNGIMDNVKCTGKESSLWHCRAKRDTTTFPCSSSAYVVCAGAMKVKLMDGLGKCAGRVEIQYKGQYRRVAKEGWTENNSNTICKQRGCGNEAINQYESIHQKYTQGSSEFLDLAVACDPSATRISKCITGVVKNPPRESTAVMITCEKHKVVFLKGSDSCSGKVGIEHGSKTYWLSGSKKTWNQESANAVCREMHCGEASSLTSIPNDDTTRDIWDKAYSCSSDATSLFNCNETQLPSDHNNTTLTTLANVICSEKIGVNLTSKCWGNVNVCVGTKCGGVCNDSWAIEKSDMLCKNLVCGEAVPDAIGSPEQSEVHFKSLHLSNYSTNLNQCKLVKNGEKETTCNPAYVVCSASFTSRFVGSRSTCSGNVEVGYGDKWFPVCMDALSDPKTQNTICEEQKCGQALKTIDYFGSASGPVISQMNCSASAKSFKECKIKFDQSCTLGGLRCSGWNKTELKTDKACSGYVYVHSQDDRKPVPSKGLTGAEGDELCQDVGCGKLKSFSDKQQQLVIECEGEPSVTLSRKCGGEVMINKIGVCSSTWEPAYSHKVCQEHDCSNAISVELKQAKSNTKYHHVTCEDYHHRLGQCNRFEGQCDGKLVSVYCVGSVQFRTTETCGGQIEVNYRNKWEKVCLQPQFPYEMLCKHLGCDGHNSKKSSKQVKSKKVNLETTLNCTKDHKDIRYCVSQSHCGTVQPAEIYCDGYVDPPPITETQQIPVVPIILGVGSFLVLVILIVVCARVYMVRKAKRLMNVSPRMSREEAEFESGDSGKYNEMEDFGHGGFKSESEVIRVGDVQSTSSFPYDDIDEAQPLTSEAAAAAGAPGDNYIRDRAIDQSSDGVTYEVEDPPDNYDDIESGPEISQTKVEVHDSPQSTAESVTVTPPGLVLEDEGYLVPDQDV